MKNLHLIILSNEFPGDHHLWEKACARYKDQVTYRTVNLTTNTWLEDIQSKPFDILLAKPPGLTTPFKQLYDERIYILGKVLNYTIFPSPEEIFIYENKRLLSFWLKASGIPHPATHVFYSRDEAVLFINSSPFPLVAKTNIGASGSGIKILHNNEEGINYIQATFSGKGAAKRTGPNLEKGGLIQRGLHYLWHPGHIKKKLTIYKTLKTDIQRHFVVLQEFIPHQFEWRVVRIGDSFFAHKKLLKGEKSSGAILKSYEDPPLNLLNFVKQITDKYLFYSQAVDIFESTRGYLINEMQCIFGQSDPYQMLVNGIPGRYRFIEGVWVFEEGNYAVNACFNLRLDFILNSFHFKR